MYCIARLEGELSHAPEVSRVARSLEPVHHDEFAMRRRRRTLGVNQHLNPRLGLDVSGLNREASLIEAAHGEIRSDGQ